MRARSTCSFRGATVSSAGAPAHSSVTRAPGDALRRVPQPLCDRRGAPTAWAVGWCGECRGWKVGVRFGEGRQHYDGRCAKRSCEAGKERGGCGALAFVAAEIRRGPARRPRRQLLSFPCRRIRTECLSAARPATGAGARARPAMEHPGSSTLIARSAARPRQAGLALMLAARRGNVRGTFVATAAAAASACLVDDVYTSGETVNAAASALRKAGARRVDRPASFARAVPERLIACSAKAGKGGVMQPRTRASILIHSRPGQLCGEEDRQAPEAPC